MTTPEGSRRPRAWYWNTYFLFGITLAIIGMVGLVRGAITIGDPGQIRDVQNPLDPRLPWIYFGASALFLLNGIVSHKSYLGEFGRRTTESVEKETSNA